MAILGVALVASLLSFVSAYDEAYELQDDVLRQIASLMDRQHVSPDILAGRGAREGYEKSRVIVQRLGDATQCVSLALIMAARCLYRRVYQMACKRLRGGRRDLPGPCQHNRHRRTDSGSAGDRLSERIARASALRTVMPFLLLVPILLIAIPDLVRKMFRRVALLAHEIDQRAEQELHPVEYSHIPAEVRPFVAAINRLLARVARSMEVQRRFVADTAHELRTPLTALSLQAELVSEKEMSNSARERLGVLRTGIERGRNLLNQLLTFARAQSFIESPKSPISF